MPSIPVYNQEATDDLNRAKRRVVQAEKAGIANLTTKPAVDMTNGKADDLAEVIINSLENMIVQVENLLVVESVNPEDIDMEVMLEQARGAILLTRASRRLVRVSKQFASVIQFTDLEKITEIKSLLGELGSPAEDGTLSNRYFDVAINKIGDALDRMDEEEQSQYSRATDSIVSELEDALEDDDDFDDESTLSSISVPSRQGNQRRIDYMFRQQAQQQQRDARALLRQIAEQMRDDGDDDDEGSEGSTLNPASVASRAERARRQRRVIGKKFTPKDYLKVVKRCYDNIMETMRVLGNAFYNFNQFRQQQLPPDEEKAREQGQIDEAEVFEGRGRFRTLPFKKPVYSIGNKALDVMYQVEGLPKFL